MGYSSGYRRYGLVRCVVFMTVLTSSSVIAAPQSAPTAPLPQAPSPPPVSPASPPKSPEGSGLSSAASPVSDEPGLHPPQNREHAVDEAVMRAALKHVTEHYEREAKKFTDANRAKASEAYKAAMAKWDAARKHRNDDSGSTRRRDEEQAKRRAGEKPPPAPRMPDYVSWGEQMQAEVRDERARDPESGKKERLLISDNHQLNCKPVQDFIKKYRGGITDARLKALLRQAFEEYERRWMVELGLASDQGVVDP